MNGLLRFVVRRPVAVVVAYLILLIFGVVSLTRLPIDLLPDVAPPVLTVVTPYPGAGALDVETKVSEPIEDSLGTLAHLDSISSISRDNVSIVTLVFDFDADLDRLSTDVRQSLDGIRRTLPRDAQDSMLRRFGPSDQPMLVFAITAADADVRQARGLIEDRVIEPVQRVPGVGAVTLINAPERVVRVDVDLQRLAAHDLCLSELVGVLQAENLAVPAGTVDVGDTSFAVRMPGELGSLDALRALVVTRSRSGGAVTVGDLAAVHEGLREQTEVAYVDGHPALAVEVRKVSGANTVDVAAAIKAVLARVEPALPAGYKARLISDPSAFIVRMIANLKRTVAVGALLVVLVVFAFLKRVRPSLVVAVTIPASMIVTFLGLYSFDLTLNAVSLIAMALAVGMVVDNGVVVLENISRLSEEGEGRLDAAHKGTAEVGGALMASTTTTLVIFAPMIFVSGIVGKLFGELALVMIATIAGSLVVALTLTPMLAARFVQATPLQPGESLRDPLWLRAYTSALDAALRRPLALLLASGTLGASTLILVGLVGTDFLPHQDTGQVAVMLELPVGTALEPTLKVGQRVADAFSALPETELVFVRAGVSEGGDGAATGRKEGTHVVEVQVRLVGPDQRELADNELARRVVASLGPLPEVVSSEVILGDANAGGMGLGGKPVSLEILGHDLDALQNAALVLQREVAAIPGTVDVNANLVQTRPTLSVELDRELAGRSGVLSARAGQELRLAMNGAVATRYTGGDEALDVIVRLSPADRADPDAWREIPVRSELGTTLLLGTMARRGEGESPVEIRRRDRSRVVTVQGGVQGRPLGDVAADVDVVLKRVRAQLPPGLEIRQGGAVEQQRKSFADLALMLALGMALVYLVMAAQFESWADPFVIMFSVPFAATGAFGALLITGTTLSITGFLGLIILVGVVVNNAIVLIDYVKLLRRRGLGVEEALRVAGQRRLRPVLITTLTTMGGMLPLALATGDGAELWGPMGRTALGGLAVSTGVTLVLVPAVYLLLERARVRVRGAAP